MLFGVRSRIVSRFEKVFHPLGRHRPRVSDELCFRGILIRLVTGCSWETAESLLECRVSDTTLQARRDEWVQAGVFDDLAAEAVKAYDRICGLDMEETSIDGSVHKAPCGGPGTGKNPYDRGKLGWKWSLAADAAGIPVGWAADGANRHDSILFEPTLKSIQAQGLIEDIGTLHLDRGYDYQRVRDEAQAHGIKDVNCTKKRKPGTKKRKPGAKKRKPGAKNTRAKKSAPLGMRWTVERTNSWLSNFGQLRRNTDRQPKHRIAQLCLATALIITIKLINRRNRWNPTK